MKKIGTLAVLVLALVAAEAAAAPSISLGLNVGWDLDFRVSAEMPIAPNYAVRAEIGSTLFSLEGAFALTYGLTGIRYFDTPIGALRLGIAFGVPDGMVVFTERGAGTLSLGGAVLASYGFGKGVSANLRAGVGYPFIYEGKSGSWGKTAFGGFWPDLMAGIAVALP
jgi:hypothetical protein